MTRIGIFGEVLFDHFPDGKKVLGGAPFNVAWHLQAFGEAPLLISRVGRDAEGEAVREAMADWGMDTSGLQSDDRLATGRVSVSFVDGEPAYDIVHPVAFDAIGPEELPRDDLRMLYHGSLALRAETSRQALGALLAARPEAIFVDVNLRPPWWQVDEVLQRVGRADWVKLNHDELRELGGTGGPDSASAFLAAHELEGLLVTEGARGARLLTAAGECLQVAPEPRSSIVDTVGAGDAFASIMILGLAGRWPLSRTIRRAQDFASAVCCHRGAVVSDRNFYRTISKSWQAEKDSSPDV